MIHTPAAPTAELELLSFETALQGSGAGGYDRDRWLYVPDFYSEYRYILGVRGARPLICVGINPSTAAPDALDPTLKSVSRISASGGYDSWMMFNVYAQRATKPDDMEREPNLWLHRENMAAFRYLLSLWPRGESPHVWAAWGAIIEKRDYLRDCVRDMADIGAEYGVRWLRAGRISVKGHPHHPLYLRSDEPLQSFDIDGYLSR